MFEDANLESDHPSKTAYLEARYAVEVGLQGTPHGHWARFAAHKSPGKVLKNYTEKQRKGMNR